MLVFIGVNTLSIATEAAFSQASPYVAWWVTAPVIRYEQYCE